ncbi:MAG: MBL fold metallo-hydrolase [Chloroflexi bacterium]|nr:MBL fold metallo-hydrolase [Chloroflexota bacterium]
MHKLASGLYAETSFKGVNVGAVVTKDGIICIDTPTSPADCRKWRLKLTQLSQQPIRFVINSDHHQDRVLGNQWFEAPVVAHELTAERIRAYPEVHRVGGDEIGNDFELADELAGVRLVPPQLTFGERLTLIKGGHEIHLIHMPGSAPGAIWVHFPGARIVFTGDAVVVNTAPFLAEADIDAWLESLAVLRKPKFPADVIVPGRGPLTDKEGVKATMDFLKTARRKIVRLASRRAPADSAGAVPELLEFFPVSEANREHLARRVKTGLDRLVESARGGNGDE